MDYHVIESYYFLSNHPVKINDFELNCFRLMEITLLNDYFQRTASPHKKTNTDEKMAMQIVFTLLIEYINS
jgi:hypothetical protein